MFHKICFISFMLIFVCLYLYVKIEAFDNPTTPQTTISNTTISAQLTSEIARILEISSRRIINLKFSGDISNGSLMVAFFILEPNALELAKQEPNATDAAKLSHQMTASGTFKVFINGFSIVLYKMPRPTIDSNVFFDNPDLKEISTYSDNKYISVPNDASLTNFYALGVDNNFNIVPQLASQPTISNIPQPISFA